MTKAKKSWQEKLADNKGFPRVSAIDGNKSKRWGTGTFVIPAPMEVDAIMRQIPKGKLTTIDDIRKQLAQRHGATIACPITTGIFAWIAAHAAAEATAEGRKQTTPYWRTLKTNGEINPKYPGGIANITRLLKSEGHKVVQRGKRFFVQNYETCVPALTDSHPSGKAS
jgi:alkylated DNA nucleotide flippase Atl1